MTGVMQDLRIGARTLLRTPVTTGVLVATLGLGIAAVTVVTSALHGTVLRPFPFPEPQRVVGVGVAFPRAGQELAFWEVLSPAEYQDVDAGVSSLDDVVAWDMGNRQIDDGGPPQNTFTAFWWGDALETVQMEAHLGRGFSETEIRDGAAVALLSHRLWASRFGADSALVGRDIPVNGTAHTVIGILPEGLLIYGTDLWTPMPVAPQRFPRDRRQFQILGRVAEDADLRTVNTELEGLARRVESAWIADFPEYAGWRLEARSWTDINVAGVRPAALVLTGAVAFVLLLVCANVANVLLARSTRRRREMSLRTALGAGRARLVRQLLTEALLLSSVAALLGLGLSVLGTQALRGWLDTVGAPLPGRIELGGTALLVVVATGVGSALLFGLLPALQAAGGGIATALRQSGPGSTGSSGHRRMQRGVVALEAALAVVLLVGGGLLVRSLGEVARVDPGWPADQVLTLRLTLPTERYDPAEIAAFFPTLAREVEALPGVVAAGAATQFPGRLFARREFAIQGRSPDPQAPLPGAYTTVISPGYLDAAGLRLLRGRPLTPGDGREGEPVALVNETAARALFPGDDPLGQRLKTGGPDSPSPWFTVVGVVADTRNVGLERAPVPEVFAVQAQAGGGNQLFLLVRTEGDPRAVVDGVRSVVAGLDPDQAVYAVQTGERVYADDSAARRATATLLGGFALFALLLAALGIYGVVSHTVGSRRREIGVRMALGAPAARVRRGVVTDALLPVVAGTAAGVALSLLLGRGLQGLLFGVAPTDLPTLLSVVGLLLGAGLAASWIPARRASRLDPAATLRAD
jgi:putative ABC transport system permease protein